VLDLLIGRMSDLVTLVPGATSTFRFLSLCAGAASYLSSRRTPRNFHSKMNLVYFQSTLLIVISFIFGSLLMTFILFKGTILHFLKPVLMLSDAFSFLFLLVILTKKTSFDKVACFCPLSPVLFYLSRIGRYYYWWTTSIKARLMFSRAGFASWGLSLSSV